MVTSPTTDESSAAAPASSTETLQKLKGNMRVVVDKLNEICKVNTIMLEKIRQLTEDNDKLTKEQDDIYEELYYHKVEITGLNQYGRRENVEFAGIPESVEQDQLQAHVIAVMKSMGMNNITGKDIHALHRIGKKSTKPRNVIVRFVNRKTAFSLLKNKKKLNTNKQYKQYFITENLCPYNKKIFNRCYRLKKNKELHSVWSYNGNIFVKVRESDQRIQVEHLDDIDDLFTDGDDDESVCDDAGNGNDNSENSGNNSTKSNTDDFQDNPDNVRDDHAESTAGDLLVATDGKNNFNRRRSSGFRVRPKINPRNLSMVEEVDSDAENSILRTPIPPLVIHI